MVELILSEPIVSDQVVVSKVDEEVMLYRLLYQLMEITE